MIRWITAAACLLLVLRGFAVARRGEGAPPARGETVTLEMSVWGMPWENDLYTRIYLPRFERENPGIRVRFHHFDDYNNRILLSHAGGIAPDVIRQNIDSAESWIRRGLNLPLDRFIDGPDGVDRRDFLPLLWEGLTYQGQTYGLPQDINLLALFYNKSLFDRAGIPYPEASWTWSDLKAAADRMTREDRRGHAAVVGLDMAWGGWSFRPFLYQAGGRCWNRDKTRAVIDSPEAVEALRFYRTLMRSYSLTQSNSQRGGLGPDKFFEAGKVAMMVDGSWRTPSLKKNAPQLRFGVAPLPRGRRAMSVSTSCFWAVSSQTRHPEAAWKLAKFLSSTDALVRYWQVLWVAPPARWSAMRSPRFRWVTGAEGRIPGIGTAEEWAEKCGWIVPSLENGWTTIEGCGPYTDILMLHLNEAVDQVLLENADPARALRTAAARTNERIRDAEAIETAARRNR